MAYIKGKNALLTILKDGDYYPFLCATACSITTTTELKDVRTVGDGVWKKKRGQSHQYSVSLNGLIELQETSPVAIYLLREYQLPMLAVPFRMIFTDDVTALVTTITGNALIETSTLTGAPTGFASSAFEMTGDGAYTIADSTTICEATIESIEITAGDPDSGIQAFIAYSGVSGAARLEYSIDGGERLVIFGPGTSGNIPLSGLAEGPHTVTVWAVCENGIDGESNDLVFEIEPGGEPAPACTAPGTVSFSSITATTANASWAPPDPVPDDGYAWELFKDAVLVTSGTTSSTSVNLTGLIGGETYTFRVKSLCEAGVSESSYSSGNFNTTGSCNVPGTPSMSSITTTTATATWTAPTPAPGSGYAWQVLEGVTVVDSGTTGSLSVNLTGLDPDTAYTFRVKSVCAVGNESGYNSVDFETEGTTNEILWQFSTGGGIGDMTITRNGSTVVSVSSDNAGSFSANNGDDIDVIVNPGGLEYTATASADNSTTATNVFTDGPNNGSAVGSFNTADGNDYFILGQIGNA